MNKAHALIMDIVSLAIEITRDTDHDVHANYSGHVNGIAVHYYRDGYNDSDHSNNIWLTHVTSDTEELEEVILRLNELLD